MEGVCDDAVMYLLGFVEAKELLRYGAVYRKWYKFSQATILWKDLFNGELRGVLLKSNDLFGYMEEERDVQEIPWPQLVLNDKNHRRAVLAPHRIRHKLCHGDWHVANMTPARFCSQAAMSFDGSLVLLALPLRVLFSNKKKSLVDKTIEYHCTELKMDNVSEGQSKLYRCSYKLAPSVSPDGHWIACVSYEVLFLWHVDFSDPSSCAHLPHHVFTEKLPSNYQYGRYDPSYEYCIEFINCFDVEKGCCDDEDETDEMVCVVGVLTKNTLLQIRCTISRQGDGGWTCDFVQEEPVLVGARRFELEEETGWVCDGSVISINAVDSDYSSCFQVDDLRIGRSMLRPYRYIPRAKRDKSESDKLHEKVDVGDAHDGEEIKDKIKEEDKNVDENEKVTSEDKKKGMDNENDDENETESDEDYDLDSQDSEELEEGLDEAGRGKAYVKRASSAGWDVHYAVCKDVGLDASCCDVLKVHCKSSGGVRAAFDGTCIVRAHPDPFEDDKVEEGVEVMGVMHLDRFGDFVCRSLQYAHLPQCKHLWASRIGYYHSHHLFVAIFAPHYGNQSFILRRDKCTNPVDGNKDAIDNDNDNDSHTHHTRETTDTRASTVPTVMASDMSTCLRLSNHSLQDQFESVQARIGDFDWRHFLISHDLSTITFTALTTAKFRHAVVLSLF